MPMHAVSRTGLYDLHMMDIRSQHFGPQLHIFKSKQGDRIKFALLFALL